MLHVTLGKREPKLSLLLSCSTKIFFQYIQSFLLALVLLVLTVLRLRELQKTC